MEHVDAIPEDSKDEVSENKIMRRKTGKGGKQVECQGTSLKNLGKKHNVELVEQALRRPIADIVSNLYQTAH